MSGMLGKKHSVESKRKMSVAKVGKHLSPSTEFKKGHKPSENRRIYSGSEHYKWSDSPSYDAIHKWINKQLGRPKICSKCGFTSENGRQFHWANISGEYKRDESDWVRLCASCHFKMDNILARSWVTRKNK